uniref:MD-2-related lipid-recognition domain-containing protein n=1 Tax=Strigamia maritima TaxID=126957 RepID=T1JAP7_STRMM
MERVILFATVVLSFLVIVLGAKIKLPTIVDWKPCISEDGKMNETQVGKIKQIRFYGNCTERCQFKINTSIEFEFDFDPGEDTDNLAPEMSGLLGPIEIPFPGMRASVCDSVFTAEGESCPLKKGKFYTYRRAVPIKDEYPPVFVDIKWKLITDKKHTSICFIVKSQIIE